MDPGPEYGVIETLNRQSREGLKIYKRLADALAALDTWDLANDYLSPLGMALRPPRHRRIRKRGVSLIRKEVAP